MHEQNIYIIFLFFLYNISCQNILFSGGTNLDSPELVQICVNIFFRLWDFPAYRQRLTKYIQFNSLTNRKCFQRALHSMSLFKLSLLQLKQGGKKNALVARLQLNIAAHCSSAWIIREQISICLYLFLHCLRAISAEQRTSRKPFLIGCAFLCVRVRACAHTKKHESAQLSGSPTRFTLLSCLLFFKPARTHNSRWVKGSHAATWWGGDKKGTQQRNS